MKKLLPSFAVSLTLLAAASLRAAADPFLGTWVLDTAQSRYAPGTCPRSMTVEMTAIANGVHYHSVTILPTGKSFEADYSATYDGMPSLVTGAKGILLPVSLQRESPRTTLARYTSGSEVRATSRRTVSADGKLMTVTTTSGNGVGGSFTNIGVYRRLVPNLRTYLSQSKLDLTPPQK